MKRTAWRRFNAGSGEREPSLGRNRFSPVFWLAGALFIFAILFFTSHIALVLQPPYEEIDMRSHLVADYKIWEPLVFQPVDSAILEEIYQERGLPGQLVIDAGSGSTPVATIAPSSSAEEDVLPTHQLAPETPSPDVTPLPPALTSTPIPSSTLSNPQSPDSPQSTPAVRPAKTQKTPRKTQKPDKNPRHE